VALASEVAAVLELELVVALTSLLLLPKLLADADAAAVWSIY